MPRKVKMKGVPKGAFGGMGDKVQGMVKPMDKGTRQIQKGVMKIMHHPLYPGPRPPGSKN